MKPSEFEDDGVDVHGIDVTRPMRQRRRGIVAGACPHDQHALGIRHELVRKGVELRALTGIFDRLVERVIHIDMYDSTGLDLRSGT